jgi:hypothetical protein
MNNHGSEDRKNAVTATVTISRQDLAAHLAAYGEHEASAWVQSMPADKLTRVHELAAQHAINGVVDLLQAGCLAAVEVVEGKPRPLRRARRNWQDVPPVFCVPSALHRHALERFEEYGGGTPVRKQEILSTLSAALAPRLPHFKFVKSAGEFRAAFPDGVSFIQLNARRGHLGLGFGVRHERVEEIRSRLFGQNIPRATICVLSVNMGPNSFHWPYPTETTWPVTGSTGLEKAIPEVCDFIQRTAEPYVVEHRDPLTIRETLLHAPGRASSIGIETSVFAIDYLMRRRDWVDADFETLRTVRAATQKRLSEILARRESEPPSGIVSFTMRSTRELPDPIKAAYDVVVAAWDR